MADTDQHQPAAAAPGLSEDEILAEAESWKRWKSPETWGNTESGAHAWGWKAGHEHAKDEISALRADLARTRAEAAALREWRNAVSTAIKNLPEFHTGQWGGDKEGWGFHFEIVNWLICERAALAALHSEPQPAAPVAPSAEPTHQSWCALGRFSYSHCTCGATTPPVAPTPQPAERPAQDADGSEEPETVRCHLCDVEIAAICDDCLKLVHDRMRELLDATSPDHQAGDEHV